MSLESDLTSIEALSTTHAASLEKIQADVRLTPQAKQADADKLTANYEAVITPRIDETRAAIEAARRGIDQALADLEANALPKPADPGQWTEAAARAQFIKEDLQDNPAGAAEMLRDSFRRGDKVAQHLILRYGPRAVADDRRAASEFRQVASELFSPDPAKIAKLKAEANRLAELNFRVPATATRAQRADLAQRFGLKV